MSVLLLGWDNAPYSPFRIFHIANATRDQVDVHVENGLTSCAASVDTDIEAFDCIVKTQKL